MRTEVYISKFSKQVYERHKAANTHLCHLYSQNKHSPEKIKNRRQQDTRRPVTGEEELFGVPPRTLGPAMDPMAEPRPTIEELKALRVVDLRQKLSSLGLPQSGEKLENVF